ncbi:hypothetical protein [Streptomyces sp. NPDC017673]|uniref:hypothetical protein n=1 Tax=unclassified Streptomyces TaxID=2593676 RepID=UPI00378E30EA
MEEVLAVHRLLAQWAGFVAGVEAGSRNQPTGRLLEAEPGEPLSRGWPYGWDMMPFPGPDGVRIER